MSVLRNLESKLAGLVEGTFSRAFKSEVRPVEIARKLAREMDEHRVQSLSRTYVPNEYAVWLSPEDREQFSGYEDELRDELSGYLLEHARRERVALLTRAGDRVQDRRAPAPGRVRHPGAPRAPGRGPRRGARARREEGHTMVYSSAERIAEPLREPDPRRGARAAADRRPGRAARLRRRDARALARRRHRARRRRTCRASTPRSGRRGGSWIVRDLGSTNGVKVNGRRLDPSRPQSLRARRRDRAGHLARDPSSWSSRRARPCRRRAEVRLPRRALPVPALDGPLRAEGPAPQRRPTGAQRGRRRGRDGAARGAARRRARPAAARRRAAPG